VVPAQRPANRVSNVNSGCNNHRGFNKSGKFNPIDERDNIYDPDNLPGREDIARFARGVDTFLSNNNRTTAFSRAAVAGILARAAQRPIYNIFKDFYRIMVTDNSERFTSLNYATSEFKSEIIRRMIKYSALDGPSIVHYHVDGFWDSMFSNVEDFAPYLNDYMSHPHYEKFMTTIKYLTGYRTPRKPINTRTMNRTAS
jgi:hypothetical protein